MDLVPCPPGKTDQNLPSFLRVRNVSLVALSLFLRLLLKFNFTTHAAVLKLTNANCP